MKTLESIASQYYQPEVIVIVDASEDNKTKDICNQHTEGLLSVVLYLRAEQKGAAVQRNQGIQHVTSPVIFFCDDDIELEENCIERLWKALQSGKNIGAVNAMITNQQYHKPGKVTRFMYRLMSGEDIASYAGKCIGPAWNLLPEDREEMPGINEVEWLNTTCTFYRKEALPKPAFPLHFKGYSLMEDVHLSLKVGQQWKLCNVRNARIFHDSQRGAHKNSVLQLAKMELVNRHFIMINVLKRTGFGNYVKLFVFEMWGILSVLNSAAGWRMLLPVLAGKLSAIGSMLYNKPLSTV